MHLNWFARKQLKIFLSLCGYRLHRSYLKIFTFFYWFFTTLFERFLMHELQFLRVAWCKKLWGVANFDFSIRRKFFHASPTKCNVLHYSGHLGCCFLVWRRTNYVFTTLNRASFFSVISIREEKMFFHNHTKIVIGVGCFLFLLHAVASPRSDENKDTLVEDA